MQRIAIAEYTVTLANGNARFDDFHVAYWANVRNQGKLTGRSKLRPVNNVQRRAMFERYQRGY
jgi:hypothetical protein